MRLHGRIVDVGRLCPQHAAWRIVVDIVLVVLRPVRAFGLFLGVEVIKIAEELVEAVHGRQVFIAVAEVVLAELPGCVAQGLKRLSNRDVARLKADRRAGNADLREARALGRLSGDEGRPARRAAVLRVIVGEHHALMGDAVDVRRLVADQPKRIGADVRLPDVVAEDDEDIGLLLRLREHRSGQKRPDRAGRHKRHAA
jgi:hypothetical protein